MEAWIFMVKFLLFAMFLIESSGPTNRERISRRRSLETPSIRPKNPTMGNTPSNLRPQIMDLSGPEALSDTTASSRRHSLDLHELMQSSSPGWPRQSLNGKDEDRESKSGEWIDKHEEVGYAFINMLSPELIIPFYEAFNGKKWEKFNSEKVASLTYARIQGKSALIAHFQNSSLMNEDMRCRPIIFDTPNNSDSVEQVVVEETKNVDLLDSELSDDGREKS